MPILQLQMASNSKDYEENFKLFNEYLENTLLDKNSNFFLGWGVYLI